MKHLEVIGFPTFCERDAWYEVYEYLIPIFIEDIPIGIPVLDDVPIAIQTQKLISRIWESHAWICRLLVKHRVSDTGNLRYVELLSTSAIAINRLKQL